jgi:hypothetical protein
MQILILVCLCIKAALQKCKKKKKNSILQPFTAESSVSKLLGYFVNRLHTTRIKRFITLLSLHVSVLLGHHQVTNVYNYDIKDIPIQRIRCHIIGVL